MSQIPVPDHIVGGFGDQLESLVTLSDSLLSHFPVSNIPLYCNPVGKPAGFVRQWDNVHFQPELITTFGVVD